MSETITTWLPIADAPKGPPLLLKFKDDLSQYFGNFQERMELWQGVVFVGRSRSKKEHNLLGWGFAAPVGQGGFPDAWMEGWQPIKAKDWNP